MMNSALFSKSGVELLKQRVLQRVEEQLEHVGLSAEFVKSRQASAGTDERLPELLELIESLSKALDKLIESATVFHKGVCVLHEASKQQRQAVEWFSKAVEQQQARLRAGGPTGDAAAAGAGAELGELRSVREDAFGIEQAFDEAALRAELQGNVTKPARLRLRALADLRNQAKEVEILRLEAATKRETAERLRAKPAAGGVPAALVKAEDDYAQRQVTYEQALLKVVDEFAVLKRDHARIFADAFAALKECEYRFALAASATLAPICGDQSVAAASTPVSTLDAEPEPAASKRAPAAAPQSAAPAPRLSAVPATAAAAAAARDATTLAPTPAAAPTSAASKPPTAAAAAAATAAAAAAPKSPAPAPAAANKPPVTAAPKSPSPAPPAAVLKAPAVTATAAAPTSPTPAALHLPASAMPLDAVGANSHVPAFPALEEDAFHGLSLHSVMDGEDADEPTLDDGQQVEL
jgi:hypothetical protein